jgi:hypothetical protein
MQRWNKVSPARFGVITQPHDNRHLVVIPRIHSHISGNGAVMLAKIVLFAKGVSFHTLWRKHPQN